MPSRRRFVPGNDLLEGRQMLSTAAPPAGVTAQVSVSPAADAITNVEPSQFGTITVQDLFVSNIGNNRQFRIAQLPVYFYLINTRRDVPDDLVQDLQNDLQAVRNKLNAPPSALLNQFTDSLRDTIKLQTISPDHAQVLSGQFGKIMNESGADPNVTTKFREDMNRLARVSINSPNPGMTTANDYALVVQYILAVGRKVGSGS